MKEIEKDFIEFCNKRKCTDCKFEEKQYSNDCLALFSYDKGRADAERDFQNSDYWNDYLAKVINDAKADAIDKVVEYLKAQFRMQNNPNSIFVETIVLHRDFIDELERLNEQKNGIF